MREKIIFLHSSKKVCFTIFCPISEWFYNYMESDIYGMGKKVREREKRKKVREKRKKER